MTIIVRRYFPGFVDVDEDTQRHFEIEHPSDILKLPFLNQLVDDSRIIQIANNADNNEIYLLSADSNSDEILVVGFVSGIHFEKLTKYLPLTTKEQAERNRVSAIEIPFVTPHKLKVELFQHIAEIKLMTGTNGRVRSHNKLVMKPLHDFIKDKILLNSLAYAGYSIKEIFNTSFNISFNDSNIIQLNVSIYGHANNKDPVKDIFAQYVAINFINTESD